MLSWIEIDEQRLRQNIRSLRTLAPGAAVMAVVKANAYGHGLQAVAPIAAQEAEWLGVNCIDEAIEITALGIHNPVAILGHTPLDQIETAVRNGYRQVLYRMDVARALSESAVRSGAAAKAHLKIETGTNRQGVPLQDLASFVSEAAKLPGLEIEGAYTHFANIEDTLDPSFAQSQVRRFREALGILETVGIRPSFIHTSATAGVLLYPETTFTMVRGGIGVYGIWPSRETQIAARERGHLAALAPVLSWKTRIAQVKHVDAGEYVGYGLTYRATRPMKLAVIPIGYYDGYDRKLSNSGRALVRGRLAPVIGRVAMNMTMLDISDAGAEVDDEVVLIGRQGDNEIRVEELAEKIGSIPYEVVARINPLIPRRAKL